jgi:putative FmdB family regulatory protein
MPTYEYRCPACGTNFEKFQRMSDPPEAECPSCGEAAQRRLSAGAGLIFKGSGFYITDYRGEGYKKAADADAGGAPKSDAKPSEGKPAADRPAPKSDGKPAADKPAPKSETKPSKPAE